MALSDNVTEWLIRWNDGDEAALQALTPLVYAEMDRLAAGYLGSERQDHTLQATALVHEAYLQVRKLNRIEWKSKAHFIGIAAQVMRRILVDHARTRNAHKRGGLQDHFPLEAFDVAAPLPAMDLTVLDQALDRFALEYPRQARVVELRFFGGLTAQETAEVVNGPNTEISSRTVERDWRFARAWLHKAMAKEQGWRQVAMRAIDELFELALEMPAAGRAERLLPECDGDETLRDRVLALLESDSQTSGATFWGSSAMEIEARQVVHRIPIEPGRLGRNAAALPEFRWAIAISQALEAADSKKGETQIDLANMYSHYGRTLQAMGQPAAAAAFEKASVLFNQASKLDPANAAIAEGKAALRVQMHRRLN